MAEPEEHVPADLAERMEIALRALRRGDTAELEHLVAADVPGVPSVGAILAPLVGSLAEVVGLTDPTAVPGYTVLREIGRGGMGVVYEAEQREPRRRVALKALSAPRGDSYHLRLFQREIDALARLRHPAIATIYEAGQTIDGRRFFTMELVDGVPLQHYTRDRALPTPTRLALFAKLCDAVSYAHARGVIHRDLKPSNILIDAEGNPRILDFGLARLTGADVSATITAVGTGQVVGTLGYMSPEQACGRADEIDERCDVYALGVILFELLTDQPPYDLRTPSPLETLRIICEQSPRRPSTISQALRGDIEVVVLKALEKSPADRYQSAAELGADIERYLRGQPIRARRPSGLYYASRAIARHRAAGLLALLATGLTLVAAWAFVYWQHSQSRRALAAGRAGARGAALAIQQRAELGQVTTWLGQAVNLAAAFPDLPETPLVLAQTRLRVFAETGDPTMRRQAIEGLRVTRPDTLARWACDALTAEILEDETLRAAVAAAAPDSAEAWYVRSFATFDDQTAHRYAQIATERGADPSLAALAWERRANLAFRIGRRDDAIAAARQLIALGANRASWLVFEGNAMLREGRYAPAAAHFGRLIEEFPGEASIYESRAAGHLCQREYLAASEDYRRALDIQRGRGDRWSWVLYRAATPLLIVGRAEEAADAYRGFLRSTCFTEYASARLVLALRERAEQLERQSQPDLAQQQRAQADDVLRDALRQGNLPPWQARLFACLQGTCTPDELVAAAGTHANRRCEAYYYAGEGCRWAGRRAEAREWFARCVQTGMVYDNPSAIADPMAEYHLAVWRLEQLDHP